MSDPAVAQGGASPPHVYGPFADAYMAGAEREFSQRMARFARERYHAIASRPLARVADIACGAGFACAEFAQAGATVFGFDASSDMIRHARATDQHGVTFAVQDYRDLLVDAPVDLVTCMYDSLNFMRNEADLSMVFAAVRQAVRPRGVFIFDVYTVRGLAEVWGSQTELHTVAEDHFVTSQTTWDYETLEGTKTLYGFSRREGVWHRWQETHHMVAHPLARLRRLLAASRFADVQVEDWGTSGPVTPKTLRAVFVCTAGDA